MYDVSAQARASNQCPKDRFSRRTTWLPRYFAMSRAGISFRFDFFGDLLSPSDAVVFAIDHELISIDCTFRQHVFVDALDRKTQNSVSLIENVLLVVARLVGETLLPMGCW